MGWRMTCAATLAELARCLLKDDGRSSAGRPSSSNEMLVPVPPIGRIERFEPSV